MGIVGVFLTLLGYSLTKPYVGPFSKPHEGIWRAVSASGLFYLFIMTFLIFHVKHTHPFITPSVMFKNEAYELDFRIQTLQDI
jgi:hypothetical protein